MLELVVDNTSAHAEPASAAKSAGAADAAVSWRSQGRCRDLVGTMTPLFFSDNFYEIARAKAICSTCPVTGECLEAAQARHEPWGVWGGELFENGRVCINKRPRGRPPKRPRPPLVMEEVPLPPDLARA